MGGSKSMATTMLTADQMFKFGIGYLFAHLRPYALQLLSSPNFIILIVTKAAKSKRDIVVNVIIVLVLCFI
jgi:hypothetical protein